MSSSRFLRSRKQQTRLQFQSLPSGSSNKEDYSEAVQSRLANVRFSGAKANRSSSKQNEKEKELLPTPEATSPTAADEVEEATSSSPLSSLRTSPTIPSRSVDTEQDTFTEDDIVLPSSKRRRLYKLNERVAVRGSSSTEPNVNLRTARHHHSSPLSRSSDDGPISTPTRHSKRLADMGSSDISRRTPSSRQKMVSIITSPVLRQLSEIGSPETSGDNVMVTREQTSRKRRSRKPRPYDDFVVDNDDEIHYITSQEENTESSSHPGPQQSHKSQKSPSLSKRFKQRAKRKQEELEEDLLDLHDSETEENVLSSRTRGGPVTTQRDKAKEHFEALRRRRAGNRTARTVVSDEEDEIGLDDDGLDIDEIGDARISDNSAPALDEHEEIEKAFDADTYDLEDEDDFIVDDQPVGGRSGRPSTEIPLQFTSFASAKPRELFPHIIEWMVKNKLSPAFNRQDDLYELSFARIDDQVKAQAGSRLISSAWNAAFKVAVLARPNVHVSALPGLDDELIRTCDACNKSNHPARYDFTFSGKAYFKDTLEPIDESDEDDSDCTNEDKISRDEQGHTLAPETQHFYLGRFCAANADMGHKLTHWKHHLNEQVLSYLEEQEVLAPEAVVQREKLNKRKREREAENVVDMMQETGMIDELWQSFKNDLDDAKIGMEGYERKGGRSKNRIGSVQVRRDNGTIGEWTEGGKYRQVATRLESDSEGE